MQQNDHSFQRCSPSYVVVSKKVDKEVMFVEHSGVGRQLLRCQSQICSGS
ncbi:hypothetical protein NECAME_00823 [Necator americanus]|uniref:Uncharacterized protein n=1 Tax=Necator americanus TaxID=51031 RepID=W2SVF8_NECAM|nr:hypothetical protein NECAME_00823 [Necator americanus]ETN73734.1 hypothetical protein NECAME_00823 [Necator americanus]